MIEEQYVQNVISKLKRGINKEVEKHHMEMALELISSCAKLLYDTNLYYVDEDLESVIKAISVQLDLPKASENKDDVVLFYDGFGLDDRELAQIYLKALGKIKKLVYVTYADFKERIPVIRKIVEENHGTLAFIDNKRENFVNQIKQLNDIVLNFTPKHFFFYSLPNDVVATTLMNAYDGRVIRYLINLTDHAFWLGAHCIDKCIEFRDYGASISRKYRKIPEGRIVKLPFYPELHREHEFQGFPFEVKANQKVIFSGGSLYKTLSPDNKYYEIVDHILEEHEDVVFWYAGGGDDTQLKKILNKYPKRAYHTQERQDLYQIIRNCRLYLSTYPIHSGLMYQYAACAGRVPVTLYKDECNDGFLLNQKGSGIDFFDLESLYNEVDKLLHDDDYFSCREKQMLSAVVTEKEFFDDLNNIVLGNSSNSIHYEDIQTEVFRQLYLERLTESEINTNLVCGDIVRAGLKYIPFEYLTGVDSEDSKGNCRGNSCEVSVIVLCYNPQLEALRFTLDSIVGQENIDFEIVISDDGSEDNLYSWIKQYFAERRFTRWAFVYNESNHGTVFNLNCALSVSSGTYIKDISPGDALVGRKTLRRWIDFLKVIGMKWSFSDAVYYRESGGKIEHIVERAHPNNVRPYINKNWKLCRWNYLVLDDIALGAVMISERELLKTYCERILNKVIYAEDNVYRMMMFDGIVGCYYSCNAVLYEFGTGISTGKSDAWSRRLADDWKTTNKLMVETRQLDIFQQSVVKAWNTDNKFKKIFIKCKLNTKLANILGLYRRTDKGIASET